MKLLFLPILILSVSIFWSSYKICNKIEETKKELLQFHSVMEEMKPSVLGIYHKFVSKK